MGQSARDPILISTRRSQWKLVNTSNVPSVNALLRFVPSTQCGFRLDQSLWVSRTQGITEGSTVLLDRLRSEVESSVTDGEVTWSPLLQTDRETMFAWGIHDDTFRRDWSELGWLIEIEAGVRLQLATRGRPNPATLGERRDELADVRAALDGREFDNVVCGYNEEEARTMDRHWAIIAHPLSSENRERQAASCGALLEFAHVPGANQLAFAATMIRLAECLWFERKAALDEFDTAIDLTKYALELSLQWPVATEATLRSLVVLGRTYERRAELGVVRDLERAERAYRRALEAVDHDRHWAERDAISSALTRLNGDAIEDPGEPSLVELSGELEARAAIVGVVEWGRRQHSRVRAHIRRGIQGDASAYDAAFTESARSIDALFDCFVRAAEISERRGIAATAAALIHRGQLACRAKLGHSVEDVVHDEHRGFVIHLRQRDLFSGIWRPGRFAIAESMIRLDNETPLYETEVALAETLEKEFVFAALVEHPAVRAYGTDPRPTWQFPLERMLCDARHIFVILDWPVADWWMLQCIADNALQPKCVFVAPPAAKDSRIDRQWQAITDEFAEWSVGLPPYEEEGQLFRVNVSPVPM